MHTYKSTNGTVFIYNSDLSGEVHILIDGEKYEPYDDTCGHALVNGDDMVEFVAHYLRTEAIANLESMAPADLVQRLTT